MCMCLVGVEWVLGERIGFGLYQSCRNRVSWTCVCVAVVLGGGGSGSVAWESVMSVCVVSTPVLWMCDGKVGLLPYCREEWVDNKEYTLFYYNLEEKRNGGKSNQSCFRSS